ncbi:MAG TPA: PEP-CTERM sorting domain-containing protein, partial [Thiomicrospira sp.]|nr:PEP-CTERM sorting domain-containing protein [Thiomicrospira sp.]
PSFVTILAEDFTGSVGSTDFDLNNDGTLDNLVELGTVYDAIGVYDRTDDILNYASQLGGVDLAYIGSEPELVFRDSVNLELYSVSVLNSGSVFDANGNLLEADLFNANPVESTFGLVNPTAVSAVPEASVLSMMLGGLGLVGFMAARHNKLPHD